MSKGYVLITGTTSGIGEALAHLFAKQGFNLVLVARNQVVLANQSKKLIEAFGIKVSTIVTDLSDPASANLIYEEVKRQKLAVEILINNAGFNEAGEFVQTRIEKELQMIQVHISTLTHLTKLFVHDMVKRKCGKIVNLGSTGSFAPCPLDAVYAATKAYVLSFSNALAAELKGTGVTVTTICPGATKTEFAKKAGITDTLLFNIGVMPAEKVAQQAYQAIIKGKRYKVIGLYNKGLVLSMKLTPAFILDPISKKMLKHK